MSEKFEVVFLNVFGCTKGKKWDCEMMGDGEGMGGNFLGEHDSHLNTNEKTAKISIITIKKILQTKISRAIHQSK